MTLLRGPRHGVRVIRHVALPFLYLFRGGELERIHALLVEFVLPPEDRLELLLRRAIGHRLGVLLTECVALLLQLSDGNSAIAFGLPPRCSLVRRGLLVRDRLQLRVGLGLELFVERLVLCLLPFALPLLLVSQVLKLGGLEDRPLRVLELGLERVGEVFADPVARLIFWDEKQLVVGLASLIAPAGL